MKKIFLLFAIYLITLFVSVRYCSAQTLVNNFQKVDADTTTRSIQLKTNFTSTTGYLLKTGVLEVTIICDPDNTGTIQFMTAPKGVTYPIRSSAQGFAAEEKFITTIYVPNTTVADFTAWNIYYKGSASSGNSFTVIY